MAVLAPLDWKPPRDPAMDTQSSTNNQSVPRQRASPSAEASSPTHLPASHPQQQPYPYQIQQQPQGGWSPSISAQPFYPAFYQNHPHPHHHPQQSYGHLPHSHPSQQSPYYDPANAQLAQAQVQWAYQQMMYNAQQQGFAHMAPQHQQARPPGNASGDYFANSAQFNQFPNGTPVPHPSGGNPNYRNPGGDYPNQQSGAFHPYRRPTRQQSSHSTDPSNMNDWRTAVGPHSPPQPPYAQRDAAGSSSSVNSASSGSRPRTNSTQSAHSARSSGHGSSGNNTPNGSMRSRNGGSQASLPHERSGSTSSVPRTSPSSTTAPPAAQRIPHHRNGSSSSSGSSSPRPSAASTTSTSSSTAVSTPSSGGSHNLRPARPSPLSQGNYTAAEKRMSRDDSELGLTTSDPLRTERDPMPNATTVRSGGLKGRLRRALSFNADKTLREEDETESIGRPSTSMAEPRPSIGTMPMSPNSVADTVRDGDQASTATVQTKKRGRAASLFNSRLNASTDNISLSSTVSSASVMIRKLGSMGKLARRNSLAGITSLFKDKKDREGEEGKKEKNKKGKSGKGEASEASVTHATAELDRSPSGDWNSGPEMNGLSPAAKLARQHTLKSNAEAAAKAKAAHEARMEAEAARNASAANGIVNTGISAGGVPTWEKNTTTRQSSPTKRSGAVRVGEDGTRVVVEDDDSASDDATISEGHHHQSSSGTNEVGWNDDDDASWDGEGDGEGDEDVTVRVGLERISVEDEPEPWAMNVRRSVERTRKPTKGILKQTPSYDAPKAAEQPHQARARSNSFDSQPGQTAPGPLARIPSPDPDHIDGLRHQTHSPAPQATPPSLPPLAFETSAIRLGSPKDVSFSHADNSPHGPHPPEKASPMFSHANSSAPALSTMLSNQPTPTLTHRSATTPAKRLAFASNLSVYDTFSSSVYDRRSEPATWSRLTPALAQRIKEELNSYKMEEMEVHAASRIHTQFFV